MTIAKKTEKEQRRVYVEDPNEVIGWLNELFLGKNYEYQGRDKVTTTTTYYDENGNELYSEEDVEYGPWVAVGQSRSSPFIAVAPFSVDLATIKVPSHSPGVNQEQQDPGGPNPQSSEVPDTSGKRVMASKSGGYDFATYGKETDDGSQFYTDPMHREFLDTQLSGKTLSNGDVILAPGITKEQVIATGLVDKDADFYVIPESQLKAAKASNTMGTVPSGYDFLIITDLSVNVRGGTGRKENGEYTTSYSTIRTWVDVYTLER